MYQTIAHAEQNYMCGPGQYVAVCYRCGGDPYSPLCTATSFEAACRVARKHNARCHGVTDRFPR